MNTKTNSQSITSQATPASLLNCTVDYTTSGPKIAGWKPIPNLNKKVSAAQLASTPPLLGRGARRNATRVVAPAAPPPPPPASKKRKATETPAAEQPAHPSAPVKAEPPPPAPAAKKRKTEPKKAATTTAAKKASATTATSAPKKRKADEISAAPEPAVPASAPVVAAAAPAPKKRKTKTTVAAAALPVAAPVVAPASVAPPPAPVAPLAGDAKRKRRATRPKKTPAVVEKSSCECGVCGGGGWVGGVLCVVVSFFVGSLSLVFVRTWIFFCFQIVVIPDSLFSQWQFVHDSMLVSLILPHI